MSTWAFSATRSVPFVLLVMLFLAPLWAVQDIPFGLWPSSELSLFWLHSVLVLAALWLLRYERSRVMLNPVSLGFVLLGLSGVVSIPWASFPLLAWVGTAQSGEGPLFMLEMAVVAGLFWLLAEHATWWRRMTLGLTAIGGLLLGLIVLKKTLGWFPQGLMQTHDLYASLGLFLPFSLLRHHEGSAYQYRRWWVWLVAVAVLAISDNRLAQVGWFMGITLLWLGNRSPAMVLRFYRLGNWPRWFLLAVAVLFPVALLTHLTPDTGVASLDGRIALAHMAQHALADVSTTQLLWGSGAGHVQELLYAHLLDAQRSLLDPQWDFLWRDMFHTHNLVLEQLLTVGGFGLLTMLAVQGYWLAKLPQQRVWVGGLLILGTVCYLGFWWQLPIFHPLWVMALVAVVYPDKLGGKTLPMLKPFMVGMAGVVLVGALLTVVTLIPFGLKVGKQLPGQTGMLDLTQLPSDPRGHNKVRNMVMQGWLLHLQQGEPRTRVWCTQLATRILEGVQSQAHVVASDYHVGLSFYNQLTNQGLTACSQGLDIQVNAQQWHRWAVDYHTLAPGRTDLLAPYLAWRLEQGSLPQAEVLIHKILEENGHEPVGLFYRGMVRLTQAQGEEARHQAIADLHLSLDHGLGRILPQMDELRKMLGPR
ncbi:hypothetical protein [Magnetococcus sp. PR-3]|uniref:hypothetical protein n=1 Tax=Magnetococcus sp. PR-3 TaxID=3120355 RepID=UPI002FCE31E9